MDGKIIDFDIALLTKKKMLTFIIKIDYDDIYVEKT